ncbi:hypothetical protein INT44_001892 [Umbelopsis vinacea]|uniref:C2H2-type domain-containing protein n=1 Tax=Umbelopsis vinacea TaxID=44442 RepID=A0A8H7Q365_9FUNG|nr:hypothetical protein INT44_001892 [Umbelopsis vinacea]
MVSENFEGSDGFYGCAICLNGFLYRDELKYHYEHDHADFAEVDLSREHSSQYTLFDDSRKWKLKSGRNMEDVFHEFALNSTKEHAAHSFIINPMDSTCKLPVLPKDLTAFVDEFNLTDQQRIRTALWGQRIFDITYDKKESFDKDWVRNVVHSIIMEIECCQLSQLHLESWYISHIWSAFDRCFGELEEVHVIRGESASIASSVRKSENRLAASTNAMKRQMMGHRADLLIRKLKVEYACGETGKSYTSDKDTKLLLERDLKMPKMMKDQLVQLFKLCDNDESTTRRLAIPGILHFGLHTLMLVMDCPAGYVCRVLPAPTYSVPTSIKIFPALLKVIQLTWKAKALIRDMINEVESYTGDNDDEQNEIDLMKPRYRTPSPSASHLNRLCVPSCVTSPKKQKSK